MTRSEKRLFIELNFQTEIEMCFSFRAPKSISEFRLFDFRLTADIWLNLIWMLCWPVAATATLKYWLQFFGVWCVSLCIAFSDGEKTARTHTHGFIPSKLDSVDGIETAIEKPKSCHFEISIYRWRRGTASARERECCAINRPKQHTMNRLMNF